MYDLRTLRDQFDSIRDQLGVRGNDVDWVGLEKLLHTRSEMIAQVEALRHQLKKGSEEVGQLKRHQQPAEDAMASMRAVGDTIKTQEDRLRTVEDQLTDIALRIPNITHFTVPIGTSEVDNVEVRRWGDIGDVHARRPYSSPWVYRSPATLPGQSCIHDWHRTTSKI